MVTIVNLVNDHHVHFGNNFEENDHHGKVRNWLIVFHSIHTKLLGFQLTGNFFGPSQNSYGDHFLILPWWSYSDEHHFLYSLLYLSLLYFLCSGSICWPFFSLVSDVHWFSSFIHTLIIILLDWSPAFLTSDDFISSNKIIGTKWPIYLVIRHFVLTI